MQENKLRSGNKTMTTKDRQPPELTISPQAMRQMIEQEKNSRVQEFNRELEVLVKKYRVVLVPRVVIEGGQMQSEILIIAQD